MPPVYFVLAIAVMVLLDHWAPGPRLIEPAYAPAGWALFGLALCIVVLVRLQFLRHDTTIKPYESSKALVTTGVFAISRNPIYTAALAGLVGIAVVLGTASPVLVLPVFYSVIRWRFVAAEEKMLEEAFGDDYRNYKSRVRRWL